MFNIYFNYFFILFYYRKRRLSVEDYESLVGLLTTSIKTKDFDTCREVLIKYPTFSNVESYFDRTQNDRLLLFQAIWMSDVQLCELLLLHGAVPTNNCFMLATKKCRDNVNVTVSICALLLFHGKDSIDINNIENASGYSPLHLAIKQNNNLLFDLLIIQERLDVDLKTSNGSDFSPLLLAICNKNTKMVEQLLAKNAWIHEINLRGHSPVQVAFFLDAPVIFNMLLEAGAAAKIKSEFIYLLMSRRGDIWMPLISKYFLLYPWDIAYYQYYSLVTFHRSLLLFPNKSHFCKGCKREILVAYRRHSKLCIVCDTNNTQLRLSNSSIINTLRKQKFIRHINSFIRASVVYQNHPELQKRNYNFDEDASDSDDDNYKAFDSNYVS